MPYATEDLRKAGQKRYYEANKEKILLKGREYVARKKAENFEAYYTKKRATQKRYALKYPDKIRANARRDKHFVAIAGRPRAALCEICNRQNFHNQVMAFDHCHKTGKFRGWICHGCNKALGNVEDRIDILEKLIVYLQKHSVT